MKNIVPAFDLERCAFLPQVLSIIIHERITLNQSALLSLAKLQSLIEDEKNEGS